MPLTLPLPRAAATLRWFTRATVAGSSCRPTETQKAMPDPTGPGSLGLLVGSGCQRRYHHRVEDCLELSPGRCGCSRVIGGVYQLATAVLQVGDADVINLTVHLVVPAVEAPVLAVVAETEAGRIHRYGQLHALAAVLPKRHVCRLRGGETAQARKGG